MSGPRILAQVVFLGGQILGKAFVEAWRQAVRNAKARETIAGGSMAQGIGGSADAITRRHKMTLDEACNILNVKNARLAEDEELQTMLKNYEHLFKQNSAEGSSFYIQSKVARAKERIDAEIMEAQRRGASGGGGGQAASSNPGGPSGGAGNP